MNVLDGIIGGLLVWGIIRGFMRGFFMEIVALVGWALAFYGAFYFSPRLGVFLSRYVEWDERYVYLLAFFLAFTAIICGSMVIGRLLTKLVEAIALGVFNRLLGAVLGGLKMALIVGALILLAEKISLSQGILKKKTVENSGLYKPVRAFGNFVFSGIMKHYEEHYRQD